MSDVKETITGLAEKAYEDGLKPAVQSTGALVDLLPRTIRAILFPLEKWVIYREYSKAEIEKLLAAKLNSVDVDMIVEPEPYVAVPAINALSYSLNSKDLRELYANLLARSMIKGEREKVHPGFVDIIKQMSPLDASNMQFIIGNHPIAKIVVRRTGGGETTKLTNIFLDNPSNKNHPAQSTSISNLNRLGLVDIDYLSYIIDESVYIQFEQAEEFLKEKSILSSSNEEDKEVVLQKGLLTITPFGKLFQDVCVF